MGKRELLLIVAFVVCAISDMMIESLTDSFVKIPMAITAENLAVQYSISRQQSDEFALLSQKRAHDAATRLHGPRPRSPGSGVRR